MQKLIQAHINQVLPTDKTKKYCSIFNNLLFQWLKMEKAVSNLDIEIKSELKKNFITQLNAINNLINAETQENIEEAFKDALKETTEEVEQMKFATNSTNGSAQDSITLDL